MKISPGNTSLPRFEASITLLLVIAVFILGCRTQPESVPGAAALEVAVRLAPELRARASPEDVVFVFARAASGPRMPLAISRFTVAQTVALKSLGASDRR